MNLLKYIGKEQQTELFVERVPLLLKLQEAIEKKGEFNYLLSFELRQLVVSA